MSRCDLRGENESHGTGTPGKQTVSRERALLNPWKNREVFIPGSKACKRKSTAYSFSSLSR
ncbi:MAG: hypothetical protein ACRC42_00655 [Mycoplasma sp.]